MILVKEEMKECTFKPNISTFKKVELPYKPALTEFMQGLNQENKEEKTRSRELMPKTGNKCEDLYLLSKKLQRNQNEGRTGEEAEYEKQKDECTF